MQTGAAIANPHELGVLLRGEPDTLGHWATHFESRRCAFHIAVIVIGAGCYGAAMGCWRAPQQALFVAIKFPLIILLTTLGNALLNAMLAPLLGLNITLRQSLLAVLMSFTIASTILGGFAPLAAFMTWNAPPITPSLRESSGTYSFIMLAHVSAIAMAGIVGCARLLQLLAQFGGNRRVALRVWFAWLAGNLLLGSQLSWVLRPFIGTPTLPVEFIRTEALQGNFYEAVLRSIINLLN